MVDTGLVLGMRGALAGGSGVGMGVSGSTLAAIVRDMTTGAGARDATWVRRRAAEAGLDRHACDALDALRARLERGRDVARSVAHGAESW